MRKLRIDCPFEIKAITEDGRIEGLGAVFGNVDAGFDRIEKGAFTDWLKKLKGTIPMLWQHYSDEAIGIWDEFKETRKGLFIGGQLNLSKDSGQPDVPTAWKARALADQGAVNGLSIGYHAKDFRYEDEVRVLQKVDVVETSLVTFPMNTLARVTALKYATNREFRQTLQENLGLSRQAAEALRAGGLSSLREVMGSRQSGIDEVDGQLATLIERIRGHSHG